MLGTLKEFVQNVHDPEITPIEQEQIVPIEKYSRKKVLEERKKKQKLRMSEYIASDKKYLSNVNHNKKVVPPSSVQEPERNYITGRKPISENKFSSLFHDTNQTKYQENQTGKNLKREHNLLRAIVRTKISETQKIKISEYEESFKRMVEGLGKVSIKPIVNTTSQINQNNTKTFRSLQIKKQDSKRNSLSNRKRIQFQNCLSWTKKHRKNCSFYAQKLGKNVKLVNKNASLEKRKQILQSIHHRSASFSFQENN